MYKLILASTYCGLVLALLFKLPTFIWVGTISIILILAFNIIYAITERHGEIDKKEFILSFSIVFLLAAIEKNSIILFEISMGLLGIYTAIIIFL